MFVNFYSDCNFFEKEYIILSGLSQHVNVEAFILVQKAIAPELFKTFRYFMYQVVFSVGIL